MTAHEFGDAELLAYLDGDVAPTVAARIEQSAAARQRAAQLAHEQKRLTAHLYRQSCPPPEQLGEYHLGLLPRRPAASIAAHLALCPHCAQEVIHLQSYLGELAADLDAPVVQPTRQPTPSLAGRVRVLVAQLLTSPLTGAPALALRGDEQEPYLWEADGAQVTVEVQPDPTGPGRFSLVGLVVGLDAESFQVHLWRDGEWVTTAEGDDLGNFTIGDLTAGRYELIITTSEVEIHIQSLTI